MSNKKCCKRTSIGGQAVIEGIMMRGPHKTVLSVRNINSKEITVEDVEFPNKSPKFFKIPVIRGVYNFIITLMVGYKTLMRSADRLTSSPSLFFTVKS